jgi:cytochrome c oxidase cbb3-type subunit I/II
MTNDKASITAGSGATEERFTYDDDIVRKFATATIAWGLIATVAGLVGALLLVVPQMFGVNPRLNFGRLRPLHTNVAIFAFIGNGIFAAIYYSTQRLCKARMWSDVLSRVHFWAWQAIILVGTISLPVGITQGRESAELEWPIDLAIAIVWILVFGGNFLMTLLHRRERHMYISLWFYIAAIVTVGFLHVFNNVVVPAELWQGDAIYAGVQDAFMQWWYGHNLMAFLLIMPFLGLMYYFVPKASGQPVFSYRLGIIHFWSLVLLYVWAGPHHLHYTAIPEWASSLGMLFGLMLWMPSWGGMVNGLLTLRGSAKQAVSDPALKFFFAALVCYGIFTLEESLLSIKSINGLTQYTDWMIAHVHVGALGWNGLLIFGMLYWLLPRLFQTKIWSDKLVSLHFWLTVLGMGLYVLPIYAAGCQQAWQLQKLNETGYLEFPVFMDTVEALRPFWWLRVVGGVLYVSGVVTLAVNALLTWSTRPSQYDIPELSAPRFIADFTEDKPLPASRYADVPMLDAAKRLEVWTRLAWHRQWERFPVKFAVLTGSAVLFATLFQAIPIFLIRGSVPTIATVEPYTPLELAGRHLYIAEGCVNCHTQIVRPLLTETMRHGEYSKPDEFFYDAPALWGSRRIGTDLAREGGRHTSWWHWQHFANPRFEIETSLMPGYGHLLDADLNYQAIEPLVRAASYQGAHYNFDPNNSEPIARQQAERIAAEIVAQGGPPLTFDKQAVALIAYLQRLGVDAFKSPQPAEVKPAVAEATTAESTAAQPAATEPTVTEPASTEPPVTEPAAPIQPEEIQDE